MGRKTNYIVFVDADELGDPEALFDATISHLVKKGCDPVKRKKFINAFTRAFTDAEKMRVLGEWVQVRDVATYPFRNKSKAEIVEEEDTAGAFIKAFSGPNPTNVTTDAGMAMINKAAEEVIGAEDAQPSMLDLVEGTEDADTAGDIVYKTAKERGIDVASAATSLNKATKKLLERGTDEDTGDTGGVPVDNGTDGEPESGAAPE